MGIGTSKTKTAASIRFKAKLLRSAAALKSGSWAFITVPRLASARLPSRGMTTVEGSLNGFSFRATLEPDGRKGHWLKVNEKLRKAAGMSVGDSATLEIVPAAKQLESRMPPDLRKALAGAPQARVVWLDISAIARRDWIQWIVSAKLPQTRARRISNACDMLASGKRRVCCFDRSGFYSKALGAPK
jgi:Domain of unknown function (DUF1905)/Bacteriocin-protection, YdeI or OmpD-Associated